MYIYFIDSLLYLYPTLLSTYYRWEVEILKEDEGQDAPQVCWKHPEPALIEAPVDLPPTLRVDGRVLPLLVVDLRDDWETINIYI